MAAQLAVKSLFLSQSPIDRVNLSERPAAVAGRDPRGWSQSPIRRVNLSED